MVVNRGDEVDDDDTVCVTLPRAENEIETDGDMDEELCGDDV